MVPGMHSENVTIPEPGRFRLRLEHTLLVSFLIHALILSIKFALPDMAMPSSLSNKSREPVALSVKLVARPREATATAKPAPLPDSQKVLTVNAPAVAAGVAVAAFVVPAPSVPVPNSAAKPVKPVVRRRKPEALRKKTLKPIPMTIPVTPVPVPITLPDIAIASKPTMVSPPRPESAVVMAQTPVPEVEFSVPPAPAVNAPTVQEVQRIEDLRQAELRQEEMRLETQRAEAAAQAAAQQAAAQREAQRQEALQQEAERAQAAAQAAAQQAAQRQDALQQEVERAQAAVQAAAQQAAAQREAQRQDALQQEAERAQAAAQAAAQQAAAQLDAQRQDAQRAAAAAQAAARQAAADREAQRLEAQRQAALRQEAQRKAEVALAARAAEKPAQLPMESAKRQTVIGRAEQDLRLRMMAEGWRQKIEQNAPFDVFRAAKNGAPYENPVVTVSLRRDGSLESVVIDRSSGVPAIDNAVRRVILMLSPFAPFTSDVAMEYDVVEIRRVWTFDTAVRLLYGGR